MRFFLFISLFFAINLDAQIIYQENFNSLNTGNISSVINDPTIEGQGGWIPFDAYGNQSTSNFQIITDNGTNKYASVIGTNTGAVSYLLQNINSEWQSRTAGNNVFKVTQNFYTSSTNPTIGFTQMGILDSSTVPLLALKFYPSTGLIECSATGSNYTSLNLISLSDNISLPYDSWNLIEMTYDSVTGNTSIKLPNGQTFTQSNAMISSPEYLYYYMEQQIPNGQNVFDIKLDDIAVEAVSQSTMGTADVKINASSFVVVNNPTKDFLKIRSSGKQANLEIYSMSGRKISSTSISSKETSVNISNLEKSTYILKFTENGKITTKKIIKE